MAMSETPFITDFRVLLEKHGIDAPKFAYGSAVFDPAKPKVLYSGPLFDTEEIVAATSALVEGKWSVAGEHVHRFEGMFSRYLEQAESVMVNSGSSADLLMIAAAKVHYGWKDGDGIVVSVVGFPTSVSAITLNNLRPVFVDIEWETLNANSNEIERKLWDERALASELGQDTQIKAILVSPVLGNPPDIDRILEIAKRFNLKVLLDGCDSLGSLWKGKHLATYADVSSCSFFPSHHISCIQGGMISSNDVGLISRARQMSAWGRSCYCVGAANLLPKGTCGERFSCWLPSCPNMVIDHKYLYGTDKGYNLQPLDIQGAIGCVQMGKIDSICSARRKAWREINAIFEVTFPRLLEQPMISQHEYATPAWFGYPVICPSYEHKTKLVAHLEAAGIQTRNYFAGNILLHPGYSHLGRAEDYSNAQRVLKEVFFLGTNPGWSGAHFQYIEATLASFRP